MSKISNLSLSDVFSQALNAPKLVFGVGAAYDVPKPPSPLGTLPLHNWTPSASTVLRFLGLLQTKFLATPIW